MGSAGSGKSCALAYFVSDLVKNHDKETTEEQYIPIYLHANDLFRMLSEEITPLGTLIEALCGHLPSIRKERIQEYFERLPENKNLILILDGLDEIAPAKHQQYTLNGQYNQ